MASWNEISDAEPAFAARVRARFEAHRHLTIATLRADGSPRISGIEARFTGGELVFGSMPGALKGRDLRRDPRFALHSATVDPVEGREATWPGEAKVAGRAVLVGPLDGPVPGDAFRADLDEVVLTALDAAGAALRIESWTPARGHRVVERG